MSRIFGASPAIGFSLAAALAYAIVDNFGAAWMGAMFAVLAGIAAFYIIGWVWESIALMVIDMRTARVSVEHDLMIAHDRTLILAEQVSRMSSDALRVFENLAGAQYDPYDPASVIIPGFAFLTRAFATAYFASCTDSTMTPVRAYSEGRRDRQRDQAVELIDWLVTGGYAARMAYNTAPVTWTRESARGEAMEELGITV